MASEAFKQFIARPQHDDSLKRELEAKDSQVGKAIAAIIQFAESKGYAITAEDIRGQLTERELDAVVGGLGTTGPSITIGPGITVRPDTGIRASDAPTGDRYGQGSMGSFKGIVNQLIAK